MAQVKHASNPEGARLKSSTEGMMLQDPVQSSKLAKDS